jgi:hypothetical protein
VKRSPALSALAESDAEAPPRDFRSRPTTALGGRKKATALYNPAGKNN